MHRSFKAVLATLWLTSTGVAAVEPLPQLSIDPTEISVSGLSSGGFMAVQMHVAYSATFTRGAGVVAGGPFFCAEGSIVNATGRCMAHTTSIPVGSLVNTTSSWASSGRIDPLSNLRLHKVYLFSGTRDTTVRPTVMNDLRTYYQSFVSSADILYRNNVAAEHGMVTDDVGNACATKASPWINDCDFDLAGEMLAHLHGPLSARNDATLSGAFIEFDQTPFVTGHGMAASGWAYVPRSCGSGERCKLHVAFHGCQQNVATVGQAFVRNTGYNRWADTNHMVVLYPQTSTAAVNGCWDWWGYDSPRYAEKSAPQMTAVVAMIARVSSGTPPSALPAPTGLRTSGGTSSSMVLAWAGVDGASGYNVYRNGGKVNASLIMATTTTDTGLAAGTTYTWTVTAVDANGAESAPSAPATGTTTGVAVTCTTANNYAHTSAGRATNVMGFARAKGSNQNMGLWNVFVITTLKQTGPDFYVIGTCP